VDCKLRVMMAAPFKEIPRMAESAGKSSSERAHAAPPRRRIRPLTGLEVSRLCTESLVSPSAIQNWASGGKVTSSTDQRLTRAAGKLGIS
jgi:hypothetical protein